MSSSPPVAVISQCPRAGTGPRCAQGLQSEEQAAVPALESTHSKCVKADAGCRMGHGAGTGREAQDGNTLLGDRGAWDAHPAQLYSSLMSVVFS